MISVDGTDFQMFDHGRKLFSLKNKKSGLRYEICLNIITGNIVRANGPYLVGAYSDITIFRDSLITVLDTGERVEADDE